MRVRITFDAQAFHIQIIPAYTVLPSKRIFYPDKTWLPTKGTHTYPALWLIEPASAFPEPQGKMPTGIFIACSQSGRSIRPLITYCKQITNKQRPFKKTNNIVAASSHILNRNTMQTSCSRPSPEMIMMPSHSGREISLMSSLAWFWRSVGNTFKWVCC